MKKLSLFIFLALLITIFIPAQVGATGQCYVADLSIAKSDNPDPVFAGHDLTYTINVNNNGPDAASDVYVFDMYPSNAFAIQSTTPSQGTVSHFLPQWVIDILDQEWGITELPPGYSYITWDVGNLAKCASAELTIVATVNPEIELPQETPIINRAVVVSSTDESNWNNNIVEVCTSVEAATEPVPTTLTLEPDSATNQLPEEQDHTLTLTVKDQYGQGIVENVNLSSINGTLAISQIATNSNGVATFDISSSTEISDTITATSTTVPTLSDTATKSWVMSVQPTTTPPTTTPPTTTPPTTTPPTTTPPTTTPTTPPTTTPLTTPAIYMAATKYYFTVDFLGKITTVEASKDGRPLEDVVAYSRDNAHLLEIKAGTRATDSRGKAVTYIVIRRAEIQQLPQNTELAGGAYNITPSGTAFDKPINLSLGLKVEDLPDEFISIGMAYYDPDLGWRHLNSVRNQVAGAESLTSTLNHFTVFAILVEVPEETEIVTPPVQPGPDSQPPAAASFVLSNLSITTSESKTWKGLTFVTRYGEDAEITLDATNIGGQTGTYQVFLLLNGARVDTLTINLAPEETQHIVFNVTGNEPGIYTVHVGELTGEFESSFWINWWLMAGFTAAFILLVLLSVYLIRIRGMRAI